MLKQRRMKQAMNEIKNKQMNCYKKTKYTLVDIFRHYPYKNVDETVVQGRNHVPLKEVVKDHEYSVTLAEYKEILTACFDVILEKIITGTEFVLPYSWGKLFMVRWKPKHLRWWEDYSWTDGYKTTIRWKKTTRTTMGSILRFFWSEKCLDKIKESLDNDRYLINNYIKL